MLIFLLLTACFSASPQESSTLYRGLYPKLYPFKYNGTYYWESKEFTKGNLMFNGKYYQDVLMNVDAHTQNLLVSTDQNSLPVLLDRNQVQWFQWKGRTFVNLQYYGFDNSPEGFFTIARDGDIILLSQTEKLFKHGIRNQGPPGEDDHYDQEAAVYFDAYVKYYAIRGNKVDKISKFRFRRLAKRQNGEPRLLPILNTWHQDRETSGHLSQISSRIGGIGLPDGYFAQENQNSGQESDAETLQATYYNKVYVIGEESENPGPFTLKGLVRDKESGEALSGVIIYDQNTRTYTTTNKLGQYTIRLPKGDNIIHFSEETKQEAPLRVRLMGDGDLNVDLSERIEILKEAVISASSMENHRRTAMGIESVSMKTMGKIPSAFGEGDILRAVLTLPGIKTVGEASGGFNVRGGAADENLILYNGNTIYNPTHLFGIFSAFNPDIVDHADVYKSSIPVEFGGRLSSVLDIQGKDGDRNKVKGSLGLGVVTGRFHLEGPIVKDKTTFIVGGRTTYSDWILKRLPKESAYSGGKAGFSDINAGITHRFDSRNSLKASFYYSADNFALADTVANSFGNLNASIQFRHRTPGDKTINVSAGFDRYRNKTGEHDWESAAYDLTTRIYQAFLRADWKKQYGSHLVGAGANLQGYALDPGILAPFGNKSGVVPDTLSREYGLEPALFVSDSWKIGKFFSVDAGVRLSSFYAVQGNKFFAAPDVRLSAKYSPEETLTIKGGVQTVRQYLHLISNSTAISPMDTWRLSGADIRPSDGFQAATGIYWTHVGWGLDFSAETYLKLSSNLLDYRTGATLSMNRDLAKDLIPVRGRSYGVELMVKKPAGSLTGWVSYTYSRAKLREMNPAGYTAIAAGNWYNAPYDKPHELKLSANWAMTHRYSLSLNVDYSTGRPITVPIGFYSYMGALRLAYSDRNVYRIPDYFRVDAAFNIDPGHYLKALTHTSVTIGVYNITGRKNPYSVYFNIDEKGNVNGYMLSVFATQVPYVNLNILF